jgi:thioesterase domain-containing protein/acyl carrier protein
MEALAMIKPLGISVSSGTTQDIVLGWFSVVLNQQISVDDNFFELGGDSLAAVTLVAMLNSAAGSKHDLSVIFERPTPRDIAELLDTTVNKISPAIRVLRTGTGDIPIVCIHFGDGRVGYYSDFLAACPPSFPVLGTYPDFSILDDAGHSTIESYVSEQIKTLRSVNKAKRLVIMGTCVAALIAFETARQLKESGNDIFLLMIDPDPPPTSDLRLCPTDKPVWFKTIYFTNRIIHRIRTKDLGTIFRGKSATRWFRRLRGRLSREEQRLYSYQDFILSAEAKYRPTPYDGPSITVHSQQILALSLGRVERWRDFLQHSSRVIHTTALHSELLEGGGLLSWFNEAGKQIADWSNQ